MQVRALLLSTFAVPALFASPAAAQTTAEDTVSDTIIVTGTRRLDRTVAESPVPVDVVNVQSMQSSGFTDTARALRDLVPASAFRSPPSPTAPT